MKGQKNELILALNQGDVATCVVTSQRDRERHWATSRHWRSRRDVTECGFNPRRDVRGHVAT